MSRPRRGKRGKHTSPRRLLSASKAQWETWDRAAEKFGWPYTFADWAREALDRKAWTDLHTPSPTSARISARISAKKGKRR